MRILFHLLHPGYARNYESTIELLAERGHEIHLVYPRDEDDGLVRTIADRAPGIVASPAPSRSRYDPWRDAAWWVRMLTDAARFMHPRYAGAPLLRARPRARLEKRLQRHAAALGYPLLLRLVRSIVTRTDAKQSRRLISACSALEECIPPARSIDTFIRQIDPDVVLVTPLVNIGSTQVDYVKSAQALGLPVGVCVASWDNLTNKGLIRVAPDAVFVWNEAQRREAVEMHDIAPERVVATGAQRFDEWFARRPSRSREEFAERVGLPTTPAYLLYACSSRFIAPDEVGFVRRWLTTLRASDVARMRDIPVLVRPHPQNAKQWEGVDLSELGPVAIWPRAGADPVDSESKADFFDSLAYSAAVVGINTSALIESAIVGKSVFSVRAPEFEGTQEGTLHFHYLLAENGGFLHLAESLPEHIAQLERSLRGEDDDAETIRDFVASFVRPHGLDVDATPILADEIERLATSPAHAPRRRVTAPLRPLLRTMLRLTFARRPSVRGHELRARYAEPILRALRSPLLAPVRVLVRTEPHLRRASRRLIRWLSDAGLKTVTTPGDAKRLLRLRLRRAEGRLVAGPAPDDAQEELLFWIPFLRWAVGSLGVDPADVVVATPSGAAAWYAGLAEHVVSADQLDPALAFRPQELAALWRGYHTGRILPRVLRKLTAHAPLAAPALPDARSLPTGYTAVDLAPTRAFAGADDDPAPAPADSVVWLSGPNSALSGVADEEAATLRSAIVARADAVVAGYGPTTHLGVLHGVPTIAIYDEPKALRPTIEIVERIVREFGAAFTLVDRGALDGAARLAPTSAAVRTSA